MSQSVSPRGSLRYRLQPWPVALLTLVWVLLWGSYSLVSVVGGLLLAVAVMITYPLPPLQLGLRIRPWPFVVLVSRFAFDLVTASFHVAYQAVAPWVRPRGHLLTIDLRTDDDLFGMITAEMTALVPGTVVVDLEPGERRLILHVFDEAEENLPMVADRVRAQEARVLRALARDADRILGETS
ncbi:Na+/H+ antiporter subunit E [Mobilicoccus caccae]|uniref:Multisubunit sodium/proton antiporter, MrpE subunit n=1 Tax=Mobilicoccus caccae TaxID=1859295 RepID=A0ABQ6IPA8_9MICO|nr:Na+/H+ antiporter subunit E [Mobilicoccus caccae]GMA39276.1 hypothetical protein GCM10025883_13210 [Mobilicoccus caccae]